MEDLSTNPDITNQFGDGVSDESKKIAREKALQYGLFLGLINIVVYLIGYFIDPLLAIHFQPIFFIFLVISLGASIYFTLEIRKAIGGFWNFRFAFSSIFIMFLLSSLLNSVFQFLLFKVFDKELSTKIMDATLEKTTKDLADKGITGEQADKTLSMVKSFIPDQGNIKTQVFSLLTIIVFSIIIALIFAAVFKKENPIFSTSA